MRSALVGIGRVGKRVREGRQREHVTKELTNQDIAPCIVFAKMMTCEQDLFETGTSFTDLFKAKKLCQ